MKNFKRFISTMLVACMAMSMTAGAVGAENEAEAEDEVVASLNMLISSMSSDGQRYGLEKLDSLTHSNPIKCYKIEDGTIHKKEMKMFAIFNENVVVAIATASFEGSALAGMQGGTLGVDTLNQFLAQNEDVAVVFGEDSAYYYNDGATSHAWAYKVAMEPQSGKLTNMDLSDIEATHIDNRSMKQIKILSSNSVGTYARVQLINYPSRTQALTLSCWAACTSSIIEHFKKTMYSDYAIYSSIGKPFNNATGGTITEALSAIEALGYSAEYYVKPYTSFQYAQIKEHIYANIPVMMGLAYANIRSGHAVVCMGFNDTYAGTASPGTIELMDPARGTFMTVLINRNPDDKGKYFSYSGTDGGSLVLDTYSHINIL